MNTSVHIAAGRAPAATPLTGDLGLSRDEWGHLGGMSPRQGAAPCIRAENLEKGRWT
jgi:hypothetical protein